MEENRTDDCPFCAEPVRSGAILCPHCRSKLTGGGGLARAHRNRPEKQIAGVAAAVADAFDLPVTFVRLGFILLTFVNFVGPLLYVALWLLLPAEPHERSLADGLVGEGGEPSILERLINWTRDLVEKVAAWFHKREDPSGPPEAEPTGSSGNPAEGAS